jgi:fatty acid synthase subunit alpha, fungi type
MASGHTFSGAVNIQKAQDDVSKIWTLVKSQSGIGQDQKNRIKACGVRSMHKAPESRPRVPRNRRSSQFLRPQLSSATTLVTADKIPLPHLKRKAGANWEYGSNLTGAMVHSSSPVITVATSAQGLEEHLSMSNLRMGTAINLETTAGMPSDSTAVSSPTDVHGASTAPRCR